MQSVCSKELANILPLAPARQEGSIIRAFLHSLGGFLFLASTSCSAGQLSATEVTFQPPATVSIPAGKFIRGSNEDERNYAYDLDQLAYGHDRTRNSGWYDREPDRTPAQTRAFRITTTPITNRQYQRFIQATSHPAPDVDRHTWDSYGLIHPYQRTRRHAWSGNYPPADRDQHPVVLVSYHDANTYAEWLSKQTGQRWRLPSENEWVKAARGNTGYIFPWGNTFDPAKLNSHDSGPFDTVPVGTRTAPSPYGLLDAAGQVFEWVDTPNAKRAWVKGGSWDDSGCGVCRPAARHSRPKTLKHILVGFRLVTE
ncbi:hypothetical protein AB833_23455 [Chromatiales bacterium (ex Bugula neritina AB1)]|nr:hypothetical protein AB833_23455 [Chromatiales bacterium (ex Bugula neritina AB1)]